jgi:DNA-binding transcriptional LysR family regulator
MAVPSGNGLAAALLFSEDVYLAIPADVATDDRPAHLADYSGSDWVLPHVRWSCHEMIQRACGAAGFSPQIVAEISDFAAILALVGAGAGVALVPELTIAQLPKTVTLRPLDVPVQRHVFAMTREATAADPGTLRLTDLLKQAAQGRSEMPGP